MSKTKKGWWLFFSLLLWGQLVFSTGLFLWRYRLILTQEYAVYLSATSPQLNAFAEFTQQQCATAVKIGYFSTEYNSSLRARYALYPQQLVSVPLDVATGETLFQAEKYGQCVMVDYARVPVAIEGQRVPFNVDQYLVIVP